MSNHSTTLRAWIRRHNDGDERAKNQLLKYSEHRLRQVISKRLRKNRSLAHVLSGDVLVEVQQRFCTAMRSVTFVTLEHFLGLAGKQINYEFRELYRKKPPLPPLPEGHDPVARQGDGIGQVDIDDAIANVASEHRELWNYHYYMGLPLSEIAEIKSVSIRTVRRRWIEAQFALLRAMGRPDLFEKLQKKLAPKAIGSR